MVTKLPETIAAAISITLSATKRNSFWLHFPSNIIKITAAKETRYRIVKKTHQVSLAKKPHSLTKHITEYIKYISSMFLHLCFANLSFIGIK